MIYVFVECGLARPVQYCSAGSVLRYGVLGECTLALRVLGECCLPFGVLAECCQAYLITLFPWNVFHYGHSKGEEDGVFTISSRDDVSKNHAAGSGSWQCGCQRQDGGD